MLLYRFLMNRRRKREYIFVSHTGWFNLHDNDRTFPLPAAVLPPEKYLLFCFQYTIRIALPAISIFSTAYFRVPNLSLQTPI